MKGLLEYVLGPWMMQSEDETVKKKLCFPPENAVGNHSDLPSQLSPPTRYDFVGRNVLVNYCIRDYRTILTIFERTTFDAAQP